MNDKNIISPCISVCKSDPITDYCYGCGRNSEDKQKWKDPNSTNEWKLANIELTKSRLSGWQKEAWNKSYEHKNKTGNSLIKEKIILQKK